MASHQTTSSYLRNSVFDAAFEIGLVDPSLSNWLEDVPEDAEEKVPVALSTPSDVGPRAMDLLARLGALTQLDSKHSHHHYEQLVARKLSGKQKKNAAFDEPSHPTDLNSFSSHREYLTEIWGRFFVSLLQLASSRHPNNPGPRITATARAVLPDKLELKSNTSATASSSSAQASSSGATVLHSSPFVLPLQPQPQKRSATKLIKKGRSDKKGGAREKDKEVQGSAGNATEAAVPAAFSFLNHEPTPPPSDHEKSESKGFFGRLRDRSRSKSRAARKPRPSNDDAPGKDSVDVPALPRGASEEHRGRDAQRRGGGVTVVKVDQGLPQLQLDPLSNRKSADLLSALSAEFSLVAATAHEESDQTKQAIAAYYAGVLNPSATGSSATSGSTASTAKPTNGEEEEEEEETPTAEKPIPRMKPSVMDRPHPKVRTSGFWVNKDRGVTVVPGGAASRSRVARKASASRRASVRAGAGGVRRAPSHKRKASLSGKTTPTPSTPGGAQHHARQLSINGLINAIREEGATGTETTTTDFEIDTDSSDDEDSSRPTSLPWGPAPVTSDSDVPAVPAIPVIIERKPSTKSTRSSKPPALSLATNNLAPSVPGSNPRLSPSSPMRSPGSRFRRSSHGPGLASPLKPPPTSPLPPTPTPPERSASPAPQSDNELVVVLEERPQSGIVTPTAAKAVLASMPSPRQSDWFEDDDQEDSDVDEGRRTPFSRRLTPDPSRPASPSDEYIVPTPTSVMTSFQAPSAPAAAAAASDFSKPIPRPTVAGRAPATAEARARATASTTMSRAPAGSLSLIVPPPNGIPANPRPGTSPLPTPTGRVTPGHMRARPGELGKPAAPPPSTWNPPTSALTRISSMRSVKSQRGRESPGPLEQRQQQQQQQQPQEAVRSHSRDDSNGSSASQRGRMSPFPVRPANGPPSRDVSPLPSLKRTPSKMSTRQRSERVRSFHAEVGGDFDAEVFGRQSGESIRSGESEGWATTSSTRSSNESAGRVAAPRPRNYNDLQPRDMYMPSPSPLSAAARRPGTHSRGPSPLPLTSATLPLNPSPHRIASPGPMVNGPRHPALRPSASFTINRPQQMSASNLAPSPSLRIDRNSRASAYSDYSDEDDDEEDRRGKGGFDVIASRLGDPAASKSAKLLQRLAVQDAQEKEPKGRGRGTGLIRPNAPSLLTVPQRPMAGPNSPNLSPRMRNTPTPTSAGGARWI
ncbi:hypothetical protein FRC00_002879 [Tulasnella sp. 408]|nr:hypothetical protein FRC00_002879 [Tulasnella sp. 408]